jgi:hypothetical protein
MRAEKNFALLYARKIFKGLTDKESATGWVSSASPVGCAYLQKPSRRRVAKGSGLPLADRPVGALSGRHIKAKIAGVAVVLGPYTAKVTPVSLPVLRASTASLRVVRPDMTE